MCDGFFWHISNSIWIKLRSDHDHLISKALELISFVKIKLYVDTEKLINSCIKSLWVTRIIYEKFI